MDKVCGIEDCKGLPEVACECKTNNYFCQKHLLNHMIKQGKAHTFTPLFVQIEGEAKEKLIKGITLKYQDLEKAKLEMKKRCNDIIQFTIQIYRNTMKKLKDNQRYYNSLKKRIIENSQIDKEEYESGNLLSRPLIDLSYSLEHIREEINSCFNSNFQSSLDNDDECFWLYRTTFNKINLNIYKKTQQAIQFSFNSYISGCRLSNNKYFVQNRLSTKCYSIDLKSNQVIQMPDMPTAGEMAAVGLIMDTVYVINGYGTKSNEAYNTTTKQWSKIAPSPVTWDYNSGGVILDKICITARGDGTAYIYDSQTNQYTSQMKLTGAYYKPVGHGYILTNQCMFQVQENTNSWKTIQYINGAPSFSTLHGISYVFKKGQYLYTIGDDYQVWQIDTCLFGAKLLTTT